MAAGSSDGLLSSILNDDDLQLMDPAMGADGKNPRTKTRLDVIRAFFFFFFFSYIMFCVE